MISLHWPVSLVIDINQNRNETVITFQSVSALAVSVRLS